MININSESRYQQSRYSTVCAFKKQDLINITTVITLKGKVYSRAGREGSSRGTSALDWGGWSTPPPPSRFTPRERDLRYPLCRRLGGP